MRAHCISKQFSFQDMERRKVVSAFNGGYITSDAGGLLLREIEHGQQFISRFASCFIDLRKPRFIEHSVSELVAQRTYGMCFGNEDLNDHDQLRADPLLALLCGKQDVEGKNRRDARDRGKALAGKSTLNRLETAGSLLSDRPRYKKIIAEMEELEEFFVNTFVRITKKPPAMLVLDFDATDDPIHGNQEGRFFHGYYDCYCYLPLYVFCGDHLLWAQLRKADIDANLRGVFRVMIKLGMLEPAASDPYSRIGTEAQANGSTDDPWLWPKNKALARKVTDESIVLLKNDGLLPLNRPKIKRIAVIGAPLDLGAGRRGVDMGVSAIRFASLAASTSALLITAVSLSKGTVRVKFLPPLPQLSRTVTEILFTF